MMRKYSITLNEEELDNVILGMWLVLERCIGEEEKRKPQKLLDKLESIYSADKEREE